MRPYLALAVGLLVGIVGTVLFRQSLPPPPGTDAERIELLSAELDTAKARVAELEAVAGGGGRRPASDSLLRVRSIADDLRAGRPVNVDDVARAFQPVLVDLAPLFDRMRLRDERRHFDTVAGELARKYALDERQQAELDAWLDQKAGENSQRFSQLVESEDFGFEEFIRAGQEMHDSDGIDEFMETILDPELRELYRAERMDEKVASVQAEADRNVKRLDDIVGLDEAQKDQVFALMARGADDFDPAMEFDGLGDERAELVPGQSRDDAVLALLTPEQTAAYHIHRTERFAEAAAELEALGLTLPPDWDLFEFDGF